MQRLNVLWAIDHVCYDDSLHGGGRLYWNVLPHFDPERFRVVPCMLRATDTIREVFTQSPVPVRILDKAKFDPTTLNTFLRLIKDEQIHVMHLHCYAASTFGRLAGWLTGVPSVIHDYDTEVYFPYPAYLNMADRLLAPVTPRAIAASPMVREFLMQKRKIAADRIQLMLHAIPMDKYPLIESDVIRQGRAKLNVGRDTPLIGTVTKLGPQRGNDDLLRAAQSVLQRFPQAVFLLMYKPTYFHRRPSSQYVPMSEAEPTGNINDLRQLARDLGIEDQVRFIEWSDTVDDLIASCDLMVAPFQSDRFSSVPLLEAMAMGKPIIATDIGEQQEFIDDGITGYLITPGQVNCLAGRIAYLLQEPDIRRRMGQHARQQAQQYSVEAYAQQMQQLYTDLAMQPTSIAREEMSV